MLKKDRLVDLFYRGRKYISAKRGFACGGKFKSLTAKLFLIMVLFVAVFLIVQPVLAVTLDVGIEYGAQTGLGTTDLRVTVARIIRAFLGLLGIIVVVIIIYGGWVYMTSAGNPEKIDQAKKILINAFIGLVIILSSFAIASFLLNYLLRATGVIPGGGPVGYGDGGGALGAGIIESHYPPRNAFNIPRNTSIVVTFKQAISVASIIGADDYILDTSIRIFKTADTSKTLVTNVKAYATDDKRTFVFKPETLLGSSEENIFYTVELTGDILKADSTPAFGAYGSYDWTFEVANFIDITPPQIVRVYPVEATTVPKNSIIRIDFNEPINPLTIGGTATIVGGGQTGNLEPGSFDYINVYFNDGSDKYVAGDFVYSNQYQTVEFIPGELCGQNTCGEDIYCLPGEKTLNTLAKAAALAGDSKIAKFPYNGIVDMADNSLDGNKNNDSEGQPDDNYDWTFNTLKDLDLVPPEITDRYPGTGDVGVNPYANFELKFDKLLMSSTIKPDSGYDDGKEYIALVQPTAGQLAAAGYPGGGWGYWLGNETIAGKTVAVLYHGLLGDFLPFGIRAGSGIKDITQNCYNPCSGPGCVRQYTGPLPTDYIQGTPWSGTYPTCDLTGANYQAFGDFNLSYDDNGVNKLFNFAAFGLTTASNSVSSFYSYSGLGTNMAKYGGVFAEMLNPYQATTILYYSKQDHKYYLITVFGEYGGGVSTIGTVTGYVKATGYTITQVPGLRDDNNAATIDCNFNMSTTTADSYNSCPDNRIVFHNYFGQSPGDGVIVEIGDDTTINTTVEIGLFDTTGISEWYLYSPQGMIKLTLPGAIQISF